VIELLGAGVRGANGAWLFRRVCARIESPSLVLIVGPDRETREAVLDIVAGHRIAAEGRAWVDRIPVMPDTRRRLRGVVADVELPPVSEPWANLANAWRGAASRVATDGPTYLRLKVASAVMAGKTHVLMRQLDAFLGGADLDAVGMHLRRLVRASRISVLVSVADAAPLRHVADHIVSVGAARSGLSLPPHQLVS
jgi:hypothetical protein